MTTTRQVLEKLEHAPTRAEVDRLRARVERIEAYLEGCMPPVPTRGEA